MSAVLADSHTILWYLFEPGKLSPATDSALVKAVHSGNRIYISTITIIEVRYLVEKLKVALTSCDDLLAAIDDPAIPVEALPIDLAVARALHQVPRPAVPDMPDRIIAATALVHKLPLVTADKKLQASSVPTIW
jgi:PIN domain nuclease of toxin-antitoxin system